MRKTLLICALAVLFSVPTHADGEMQCPVVPTLPEATGAASAPFGAASEDGTQDGLTATILNVLGSVLALV